MNISLNWLKEFIPLDLSPIEIAETLTSIGLAVDSINEYESIPGRLKGVVVGKITECRKHPNADRLSLTKVDIGTGELLQIVCGAPNVATGQTVLVATIGSVLHTSKGEALEIKRGKIRGEVSEGMICAGDELSLSEDHSGIMVLDNSWKAGIPATDVYPVYTDTIFEVDLTPNRSDATSHIGVAKDLAAYLAIHSPGKYAFHVSEEEDFTISNHDKAVEVIVEDTKACPRYSGISMEGVVIKPSPDWLQNRLKAIGVKSINNVVDITNYVLHAYGQPLHAFDYDKIGIEKTFRVKKLPAGTKFLTLDKVERNLHQDDLMICNAFSEPLCIGGVFGGLYSGISDQSKNIFLESAHFNASSIRRTSMRHVLRTDAATRFEKGTDPNLTVKALKIAASMIIQMGGGKLASDIVDIYPDPLKPVEIKIHFDQVRKIIGQKISNDHIIQVLEALEMKPKIVDDNSASVYVPTNKADVKREIDVIEEILRIHGYNTVPMPSKMEVSFAISSDASREQYAKEAASDLLTNIGFHEMMGLSLIESRIIKSTGYKSNDLVYINNTSNVHLDIMRPDMLRSGLSVLQYNQNRQQIDLKLFEFGKTYKSTENKWPFHEHEYLTLFFSGTVEPEHWKIKEVKKEILYIKGLIEKLVSHWGVQLNETILAHQDFDYGFQLSKENEAIIIYGKISDGLSKEFDLRGEIFFAQIDWEKLWGMIKNKKSVKISMPSKFPSVRRDLSIVVNKSVTWNDISAVVGSQKNPHLKSFDLFDVFEQEDRIGKDNKSMAISFIFENDQQTLKDSDLDKAMKEIREKLKEKVAAELR